MIVLLCLICLFEMAGNNPNDGVGLSQVQMQAFTQHLERLMKQRDDVLHERLDQMENRDHNEEERRKDVRSRHQRLFVENVGKNQRKPVTTKFLSSGVVFTFEEGISTSHVCLKGQQPMF